jgi:hypothetical protein
MPRAQLNACPRQGTRLQASGKARTSHLLGTTLFADKHLTSEFMAAA